MHSSRSQQITECCKILDLSQIVDKLDEFKDNKPVIFPVISVDKIHITAALYPKYRGEGAHNDYCGFFISAPRLNHQNHYRMFAIAQCGAAEYSFNKSLEKMGEGWGWSAGFSLDEIKQHKQISIRLVLNQNISSVKLRTSSFFNQLENTYNISRLNGDVTLIIKPNKDNYGLYVPPNKKRKLNEFKCDICIKTFDSNKGLKLHMSNKRDAAHTNNKSLELNEIKMSSIILRSASKVFDAILSTNMREKQEKRIEIFADNVKDVEDLLYFMCTNELRYNCNALGLIELAHYYQMDRLVCQCTNKLIESVSVDNFIQIINTFDKYKISDGYSLLVDFGKKNVEKLKEKDHFDELSHSLKCIMLDSAKKT